MSWGLKCTICEVRTQQFDNSLEDLIRLRCAGQPGEREKLIKQVEAQFGGTG